MAMSNQGNPINLDRLAAERAQAVIRRTRLKIAGDALSCEADAGDVDNTVTKALGVLQENGVYACMLFLASRPKVERPRADVVMDEMLNLLDSLGFDWGKPSSLNAEAVLKHVSDKVTCDLERLLLAKETLEQMLIYARYGAKAHPS
jgi:hypothetical protein